MPFSQPLRQWHGSDVNVLFLVFFEVVWRFSIGGDRRVSDPDDEVDNAARDQKAEWYL
jgi:hypothetical protein